MEQRAAGERDSTGGLYARLIPQAFSAYRHIDPILTRWAVRHGITVETEERGWDIRSFWICDAQGYRRGQIWFRDPDGHGNVTVIASALDPESPTNWGARDERRASLHTLEADLEALWALMLTWGGPGAVAENNGRYPENLQCYVPRWGLERWPQPAFSRNRLRPLERLGFWVALCLLLDVLTLGFHRAPEDSPVGTLATRVADAVTIWPLTIATALLLPALLFVAIMPKAPFARVFMTGLFLATLMFAAATTLFLLLRWA